MELSREQLQELAAGLAVRPDVLERGIRLLAPLGRIREATYSHCGGLNLYPAGATRHA